MKVVLNSISIPSSEGFPGKLWEIYIKMVYSEHILRFQLIYKMDISITENLYQKNVSLYK